MIQEKLNFALSYKVIYNQQTARTSRYIIHSATQTKAHLPSLVPSRDSSRLLLVLGQGLHRLRSLVRPHELHRPLGHVLILRPSRSPIQDPQMGKHHNHEWTNPSDGFRHLHQLCCLVSDKKRCRLSC